MRTALALVCALQLSGCTKQENLQENSAQPEEPTTAATANSTKPAPATISAFDGVEKALQAGEYDTAAAQLLGMRASGKQFSDAEAAQYRQLLNDAYLQALEPAQKGEARAKAAIEMIRANPGR
jgi:hypothetical protein